MTNFNVSNVFAWIAWIAVSGTYGFFLIDILEFGIIKLANRFPIPNSNFYLIPYLTGSLIYLVMCTAPFVGFAKFLAVKMGRPQVFRPLAFSSLLAMISVMLGAYGLPDF